MPPLSSVGMEFLVPFPCHAEFPKRLQCKTPRACNIPSQLMQIPQFPRSSLVLSNLAFATQWPVIRTQPPASTPGGTPYESLPFSPSLLLPQALSCSNRFSLKNSLLCLSLSNSLWISSFSNGMRFVCSGLGQKSGTEKRLSRFLP